ncbi:MAG: hypothetical protein AAF391_01845 [Bacteroidota bacterium]
MTANKNLQFNFRGFPKGTNYTNTPDFTLDYFPGFLSVAEIRVVDYLFRRSTLGDYDVSLKQMQNGLVTKKGERLDFGCGIKSKSTITKAVAGLESKGVIEKTSRKGIDGRNLSNVFQLKYDLQGWIDPNSYQTLVSEVEGALDNFEFEGFDFPTFTPVPDVFYDVLPAVLSGGAYLVLRYICRHTFGYKKREDQISYSQMLKGIVSREGERIDYGCGVKSKSTLSNAINELLSLRIIQKQRNKANTGEDVATTYSLIFRDSTPSLKIEHPLVQKSNTPSPEIKLPLVQKSNTQETAKQNTEEQQTDKQQQSLQVEKVRTKRQTTQTSKNRLPEPQKESVQSVVVVFLEGQGFTKSIAKILAKNRTLEYIKEQADIVDFIESENPERVKNRLGFLRTAIEQGYGKPSNFKSKADLEKERQDESEREKLEQEKFQQREAKREAEFAQIEREKQEHINSAREEFGTTEDDLRAWEDVFEILSGDENIRKPLMQIEPLKIFSDDGIVTLGVPNSFILNRLIHPQIKNLIARDTGQRIGKKVVDLNFVLLDKYENKPSP